MTPRLVRLCYNRTGYRKSRHDYVILLASLKLFPMVPSIGAIRIVSHAIKWVQIFFEDIKSCLINNNIKVMHRRDTMIESFDTWYSFLIRKSPRLIYVHYFNSNNISTVLPDNYAKQKDQWCKLMITPQGMWRDHFDASRKALRHHRRERSFRKKLRSVSHEPSRPSFTRGMKRYHRFA